MKYSLPARYQPIHIFLLAAISFFSFTVSAQSTSQTGFASFYHDAFNGKRTASGQVLNQKKLTCAHRTYPFGTRLRVTNLDNCKSVVVTVNDRGPFVRGRILDVTEAAAKKLGFLAQGQAKVEIEIVSSEEATDSIYATTDSAAPFYKIEPVEKGFSSYSVKVASYYIEAKALETARELKEKYDCEVFMQTLPENERTLYRIFAGKFKIKAAAEKEQEKISAFVPDCYVVELKPSIE